nr:penicillin-binding protein 2 [Phycicoccus endophyticus]
MGRHRGRLAAAFVVVVLAFAGLATRLGQVQLAGADGVSAQASSLDTRTVVEPALRGRILDRTGRVLAENRASTVVTLERRVIAEDRPSAEAEVRAVARVLGLPAARLLGRTWLCGEEGAPAAPTCWSGSPQVPVPLATGVDPQRALALVERPDRFPGVAVDSVPVRVYPRPEGVSAAHVLGYLGQATAQEVADDPDIGAGDLVGRSGLEQEYDDVLRGTPGRTVVAVDARGLVTGVVSRTEPVPGRDLVTSLDVDAQAAAERALADAIATDRARGGGGRADSGAVVALDATSGAVVALASAPTYDPNVWTGGISAADYADLTDEDAGTPLLSRATAVALPPGSTVKPSSVVAAVRAGNPLSGLYDCPAQYRIGDRVFRNHESYDRGLMSLERAVETSCDTVFYDVAYRAWQDQGGVSAGVDAADPFARAARGFGLGTRTGVDLPGESAGRVPDRAWRRQTWEASKEELCRRAREGYPEVADAARRRYLRAVARENCASGWQLRGGDAANLAIGQGDTLATPLQLAVMYAALGNGGTRPTPRVAAATVDTSTGERTAVPAGPRVSAPLDRRLGRYLRRALRGVVTDGTAARVFADEPADWPVAGKTGTAEQVGERDTSWFAAYAPADHPQWVVTAVVHRGGYGDASAAPAVQRVLLALRGLG